MTQLPGEADDLNDREVDLVRAQASDVSAEIRQDFERLLAEWKATWSRPERRYSSDTRDYTQGSEFEAIVALGPAALPLVAEQIVTEPDGFFLLAALERWQERSDLVETTEAFPLESQQSRARRAVRAIVGTE